MIYKTKAERDSIIESNLPLVVSRVKKLNKGVFDDDLFQAGAIGLMKAVERFDENRGCALSTLAVIYIDNDIRNYRNQSGLLKPRMKHGKLCCGEIVSLENFFSAESKKTFDKVLANRVNMEDEVIARITVEYFLNRLKPKERLVAELSMTGSMTERQVAEIVGESQPNISRIKKKIYQQYMETFS